MTRVISTILLGAFLVLTLQIAHLPAFAEDMTEEQGDAILQELREIRKVLERMEKKLNAPPAPAPSPARRPPFSGADVDLTDAAASKGSPDAPVTIVEYSDYQCPYCKRFADQTLPQLMRDYVETGKVRFLYKDFPIERIHPAALPAAVAARCAGRQEKYWAMHDLLFADTAAIQGQDWATYARKLALDEAAFKSCLADPSVEKVVRNNIAEAGKAGITGTPSFLLGTTAKNGTLKATEFLRGAQPLPAFKAAIDKLLAEAKGKAG